jgi:hypothetical protein
MDIMYRSYLLIRNFVQLALFMSERKKNVWRKRNEA